MRALPPHLALAGPTASGKTDAALAIAARWPVEIISVDSALVYRGMDIGTAKPTPAQRAQVVHHLIDIREPDQPYSAALFATEARALLHAIQARGNLPVLVGGTMLYYKALWQGLDALPGADPAVRAQIAREAAERGWPALHAELARVDPMTAARLPPRDAQRIGRALEVYRVTGLPLSTLLATSLEATHGESTRMNGQNSLPTGVSLLALEPQDRAALHARIGLRLQAMLDAGLVDEVAALRARGLDPDLPALRSVGYRQVWQMLDGAFAPAELLERTAAATRQLAKRQLTWLRSLPQRQVIACDAPNAVAQVLRATQAHLDRVAPGSGHPDLRAST